ncbi:MAG: peptide ABC transporter substrate-binding protein [Clostridiaceae bacterium]|nr:peptide ABC transporter substrate-binding protein [Clostridiaceae bacterium]
MEKSTKLLAMLLILVMAVGLFTACGSKETKTKNKTTKVSAEQSDTEQTDTTNIESKITKSHLKHTNAAAVDETNVKTKPEQTDTLKTTDALKSTDTPKASDASKTTDAPIETDTSDKTEDPESEQEVLANGVVAIDWAPYNNLIADIKAETDPVVREHLMHQAEDMLMETGIFAPLTNINNFYLMKDHVEGVYATLSGGKYFMFASNGDAESLRINLTGEPARLDPVLNHSIDGLILALNSFSGLYTYDKNGELVPDLAEGVEISKDELTYTFTLKPNLKWSDSSELTAADFEWSWKRAATTCDALALNVIEGYPDKLNVKASDDGRTLAVVLDTPNAYFLNIICESAYLPVHQATVEGTEGYKDTEGKILDAGAWALESGFISNGAFTLAEWKHNESMKYVKNPNYHRADEVTLESLEYILNENADAVLTMYDAGELDFANRVPRSEIPDLIGRPDLYEVESLTIDFIIFNEKSKIFAGKTVQQAKDIRQALSLLIDRESIFMSGEGTGQEIATSFVPASMSDGHGGIFKTNDEDYTYPVGDGYFTTGMDEAKAIELLEGAGYVFEGGVLSADTPLRFEFLTAAKGSVTDDLQQGFAQYGITMDIRQVAWNVFLNEFETDNYDVARTTWIAPFNDPINMLEINHD